MNPALVALFPTIIELMQEASKTDTGKEAIVKTKKVIEVALPTIQKASALAISFLSLDLSTVDNTKNASVLTRKLDILDSGLSIPATFQKNQSMKMTQKTSNDLDTLKGQNEILFLSHSIQYFIDSHRMRVGIDSNISYALQYDIKAVVKYLEKNNEIRFPGYLLHQLMGLSKTIEEMNVFYDSIINNGTVQDFSDEGKCEELFSETIGIDNKKMNSGYMPHTLQLKFAKKEQAKFPQKDHGFLGSVKGLVTSKELQGHLGEAHEALYILRDELMSNEELEKRIIHKLKTTEQPILLMTKE